MTALVGFDCVPDFWRCQTAVGAVVRPATGAPSHPTTVPGVPPFLRSKMHRLGEDSQKQSRNSLNSTVMLSGIMRFSSISGKA